MTDLASWLLAQIADDEAAARAALVANERAEANDWPELRHADSYFDAEIAAHIARHDPARVLAECAAKRRIVEDYKKWCEEVAALDFTVMDPPPVWMMLGRWVRLLAQPYAGHPDFDPAWRVDEAPASSH